MRYTVVWLRRAENQLGEIWLSASDRQSITHAANDIDLHLRQRPRDCNEFRDDGFLFLNVGPINVLYDISEVDRKVIVVTAWLADFDEHGSSP